MDFKKIKKIVSTLGLLSAICGLSYVRYKFIPKVSIKRYTQACLYLAVMDDEICRNELEGNTIGGKELVFLGKRESLQYRYHLFLKMYKNHTPQQLEREIKKLEQRLENSKQYLKSEKQELEVRF